MKQKLCFLLLIFSLVSNVNHSQVMLAGWSGMESTSTASYPRSSNYVIAGHGVTATESYSGLVLRDDSRYFFGSMNSSTTLNISTAPYVEYQINLNSIKKIDFDRFVLYGFDHRDGKAQLRWSVDNYATSLGEFSTYAGYSLTSRNLNALPDFIGTSVTFRVYFYNATGTLLVSGQPYGRTVAITSTSINPYTSYDSTPSTYHSSWKNVGIYINSIETPVQNINIVASGGAAEGSGWSYSNGVISPNTNYDVNINSSDITSKLSQGNLIVESTASLTINSSITSNNTNSLTFKAASNILQNSGAKVQTGGGNITYWSDSDNNGQGAIVIGTSDANGGEEIKSNGGNILLAGGSDVNTGFAKGSVGFLPWSTKPYGGISVFHASINAKNSSNSSGGNIVIRGSLSNVLGSVSGRAVLVTNSNVLTQGSGTISLEGDCTNFAGSNPWGVIIEGYSLIEGSDGLITITGTGSTASGNARGIAFSGGASTSQRPFVNSKNGGEIIFTDKTNSSSANFTGTYFNMGYIGQTQNVADSNYGSGVVRIISDKIQFDGGSVRDNFTQLNTNGKIYLLPYTNSFKASATDTTIPQIFEKLAFGNPSFVQIGKSSNTSKVRIGNNSTDISFNSGYQMDIYSGGIEFYKYINPDKLRLFSSSGVTQTQPIASNHLEIYGSGATSLGNTSNSIKKLTAGTTTVPVGNLILYTKEDLLISNSDSSGLIGINSTGYITLRTYSGKNINIDRNIKTTYAGSIALSLYADFGLAANNACDATATGGSINFIRSSANIEIPASARARLFSNAPSNSTLLTNKAIDGVYYRANTNTATITTPNTGIQALYRADNVVAIGRLSSITGDTNLSSTATEATYSVSAVNGATSYVWDLPAGMTRISQTGTSVTLGVSSTFTRGTISVKAVNSCSESNIRSITVLKDAVLPDGSFSLAITGEVILCPLGTQTYTATEVEGAIYDWSVPSTMTITSGQGTNSINVTTSDAFTSGQLRVTATTAASSQQARLNVSGAPLPSGISGPVTLCGLTTATYSVTLEPNVTYQWSVPSGMTIISGATTNSIEVSLASGDVSGTVVVRAETTCGLSVPRTLTVSKAPVVGRVIGATTVCGAAQATIGSDGSLIDNSPTNQYTYAVAAIAGATSYTWSVPSYVSIVSGQGSSRVVIAYDLNNFESGTISVYASNSCGAGSPRTLSVSTVTGNITGPANLCSLTSATYSVPTDLGTDFVWTLPEGMSITSGQGTSSITVGIAHPIKFINNNEVIVSFTTGCGGNKQLSMTVGCSDYTTIIPTQCGEIIDFTDRIYPIGVQGTTGYVFNIYNNTTNELITSIENPYNFFRFTQMNFELGVAYQVRVRIRTSEGLGVEGAACLVTLSSPTTTLTPSQCGQNINYDDRVYPIGVTGATGYKFNIYDNSNQYITSIENPYSHFRFTQMDFAYGATYKVGVEVKRGDVYGDEGSLCSITLSDFPTTTLIARQCDASINYTDRVYPIGVTGATGYKFNIYDNSNQYITSIENPYSHFRFTQMDFAYGATYKVGVEVKRGDVYGDEGSLCSITLSDFPTTTLIASHCGASLNYDDRVYPIGVEGATGYIFDIYEIDGIDGVTLIATVNNSYNFFRFSQINYVLGGKYYVKVRVKRGDQYGNQGPACLVELNNPNVTIESVNHDNSTSLVANPVMSAYPNPFTTTFKIRGLDGDTATLFYQVYDVTGKMIERRAVEANEISNHIIGEEYPAGMYLVTVRQGANTKTFKMVKQ